jgi:hypothetical protein
VKRIISQRGVFFRRNESSQENPVDAKASNENNQEAGITGIRKSGIAKISMPALKLNTVDPAGALIESQMLINKNMLSPIGDLSERFITLPPQASWPVLPGLLGGT